MNRVCGYVIIFFIFAYGPTVNAGTVKLASDTQRLATQQQEILAKVDSLEQEMTQWQQMKPSVARLVVIENELKELIMQLDTIVEDSTIEPESASTTSTTLAQTPVTPAPTTATQLASKSVAQSEAKSVVTIPSHKSAVPPSSVMVAAYPSAPLQPTETASYISKSQDQGKYALQLSAVTNPAQVQSSWLTLKKKYAAVLADYIPSFERANVKGKIYFRIKAGEFNNRKQAGQACKRLKNLGAACVVSSNNGVSYQQLNRQL